MPIPADDDITKTMLWKRIDDVIEMIQNINGQFLSQVVEMKPTVIAVLEKELEENKAFIESYDGKLQSRLTAHLNDVKQVIIQAVENLIKDSHAQSVFLQQHANELYSDIEPVVSRKVDISFGSTKENLLKITDDKIQELRSALPDIVNQATSKRFSELCVQLLTTIENKIANMEACIPGIVTENTKNFINKEYDSNITLLRKEIRDVQIETHQNYVDAIAEFVDEQAQERTVWLENQFKSFRTTIPGIISSQLTTKLTPLQKELVSLREETDDLKSSVLKLVNNRLQTAVSMLQGNIKHAIDTQTEENTKRMESNDAQFKSNMDRFLKQVDKIVADNITKLNKENAQNIKSLEEKIRVMQGSIPGTVAREAQAYLSPVSIKTNEIANDVNTFKKSLSDTVGKFSTEMIGKISSLNTKLDGVLSKFKKLSDNF